MKMSEIGRMKTKSIKLLNGNLLIGSDLFLASEVVDLHLRNPFFRESKNLILTWKSPSKATYEIAISFEDAQELIKAGVDCKA